LRDGLQKFFEKLPEGVEASLYATAPQGRAIVKSTSDRKKLIDGIGLIAPDRGTGAFFESLLDAIDRVEHDKAAGLPAIVVIGTNAGTERTADRDIPDIQQKIVKDGIRLDVVITMSGISTGNTGTQREVGMSLAKMTGGGFEDTTTTTRLVTLLPEIAERIARSAVIGQSQYRVIYEPQAKRNSTPDVGVDVTRAATTVKISFDGR
jgi:hypothetical protein